MAFISVTRNYVERKVAYLGPPQAGKRTNLQFIYDQTSPSCRRRLVTEGERTVSFDVSLPGLKVRDFPVWFQIDATTSPTLLEDASVIKYADTLVFVADSQEHRIEANVEMAERLGEAIRHLRLAPHLVLQLNKRDLNPAISVDDLRELLLPPIVGTARQDVAVLEAVASQGDGVMTTLKRALAPIVSDMRRGL